MAIIRNIDVTAQSEVSFDDACRVAVTEAAKTLRGIMLFRVNESECVVEHDRLIACVSLAIGRQPTTRCWAYLRQPDRQGSFFQKPSMNYAA
jgi:flavin-binding protein dodecin